MRFPRLVSLLLGVGLLGLPALVLTAGTASAVAPYTTTTTLQLCAIYANGSLCSPEEAKVYSTYRRQLQFNGHVEADQDGTPIPVTGAAVTVQRLNAGASTWVDAVHATTNVNGDFTAYLAASSNASYRVQYAGDGVTYLASTSPTRIAKVARDVRGHFTKLTNARFRYYGRVLPTYKRKPMYLQKLVNGVWRTIGKQRTTRRNRWSFIVFAKPTRGKVHYRVHTKADTKYITSYHFFTITTT